MAALAARGAEAEAAAEEEEAAAEAAAREQRVAHSRKMADELHTVNQNLADASMALERKIARQRRCCASGDPGCLCLRLPNPSSSIGRNDLRMWLDALLKKQLHQLKLHRGVHSGSDKAALKVMPLRGLMARASRVPGLAGGLSELTGQLRELHDSLFSEPVLLLSAGDKARLKADSLKQMRGLALDVGLNENDLEEALDTLLLRWSQALQDSGQQTLLRQAAKQRDAAPKALAMRAVMRAELTNAKAAAVMLAQRDVPRTECAIRSLVTDRPRMHGGRLQRLSAPDGQRVHSAAAKKAAIVDEQRRRVGGFQPRPRKRASTARQHKRAGASATPRSGRRVKSARAAGTKAPSGAAHHPQPPSRSQRPRGPAAPSGGRRTKTHRKTTDHNQQIVMARQTGEAEMEWKIVDPQNVVASSSGSAVASSTEHTDTYQRTKAQRAAYDAEIAQMRIDEDEKRRAEREASGDWDCQSDWELDDKALQAQREAEDSLLKAERDEEDAHAKLVFDESERHQEARPDPAVKNGDANGALLQGIAGGEHLVGRRLDNGAAAHGQDLIFSSTGSSVYHTTGGKLEAVAKVNGRLALCTDTRILSDSPASAAFTVVQSSSDTGGQLLFGLAQCGVDIEKDTAPDTDRFWGISSQDGSLVSSGWSTRWAGQQGFTCGDTVELLVFVAAGSIAVKKNGKLLGVARLPTAVLAQAGDLCWAVSLHDAGDTVTANSTDASQFETQASQPTASEADKSKLRLRLDLLEAQLSARKQRRRDQARELREVQAQLNLRDARETEHEQRAARVLAPSSAQRTNRTNRVASSTLARPKSAPSTRPDAAVPPPNPRPNSRFGGPVATLGTSTRSGVGSLNADQLSAAQQKKPK